MGVHRAPPPLVGPPLLLWLEALPPTLRIGILATAAVYGLWIVRRERVPWNRLGFRGGRFLVASLRLGLPWVAMAWPALVILALLARAVPTRRRPTACPWRRPSRTTP